VMRNVFPSYNTTVVKKIEIRQAQNININTVFSEAFTQWGMWENLETMCIHSLHRTVPFAMVSALFQSNTKNENLKFIRMPSLKATVGPATFLLFCQKIKRFYPLFLGLECQFLLPSKDLCTSAVNAIHNCVVNILTYKSLYRSHHFVTEFGSFIHLDEGADVNASPTDSIEFEDWDEACTVMRVKKALFINGSNHLPLFYKIRVKMMTFHFPAELPIAFDSPYEDSSDEENTTSRYCLPDSFPTAAMPHLLHILGTPQFICKNEMPAAMSRQYQDNYLQLVRNSTTDTLTIMYRFLRQHHTRLFE